VNTKLLLLYPVFLTLLVFPARSTHSQTVITFDDLNETGSGAFFSSKFQGYQGLIWNGILCNNAILFTNILPHESQGEPTNGLSGDYYGMVSASNVAEVITSPNFGFVPEIDSPETNFNFLSAYLTGYWNSNLNIEVEGFNGTTMLYDTTVVANATSPTLFTFDYQNINRLVFASSGGLPAFGGTGDDPDFIMDNFTFEFVPEPSPLLLTAGAALLPWPLLKRKCLPLPPSR
jgi:hypothetical protein